MIVEEIGLPPSHSPYETQQDDTSLSHWYHVKVGYLIRSKPIFFNQIKQWFGSTTVKNRAIKIGEKNT